MFCTSCPVPPRWQFLAGRCLTDGWRIPVAQKGALLPFAFSFLMPPTSFFHAGRNHLCISEHYLGGSPSLKRRALDSSGRFASLAARLQGWERSSNCSRPNITEKDREGDRVGVRLK